MNDALILQSVESTDKRHAHDKEEEQPVRLAFDEWIPARFDYHRVCAVLIYVHESHFLPVLMNRVGSWALYIVLRRIEFEDVQTREAIVMHWW